MHGFGILTHPRGFGMEIRYEGPFVEGLYHGSNCKIEFEDGKIYEGDCFQGKKSGRGIFTYPEGRAHLRYEGDFFGDRVHGRGKCEFSDGGKLKKTFPKKIQNCRV